MFVQKRNNNWIKRKIKLNKWNKFRKNLIMKILKLFRNYKINYRISIKKIKK